MELKLEKLYSKTNLPIIKVNGYMVHSKYDPEKEAMQLAQKIYKPNYIHVVFGYGCGYLDQALHNEFQFNEPIVFIDPLFRDKQLSVQTELERTFYLNDDIIDQFDRFVNTYFKHAYTNFTVACLPNYDKLFPEAYKSLLKKIKLIQNSNRVNDNTLIRFAKEWQVNFTSNLKNLSKDLNLSELKGKYNSPVVVTSGGASLQKQLQLLKSIQDRVIIIAAGSTINSLLAVDLEPDYVVTIDGGIANYNHFKDLALTNSRMIYIPFNHPKIRDTFKENEAYFADMEGFKVISNYMKKTLKLDIPKFDGGASVAHLAFSVARYISNGPVALIGQDLAYTDNMTHASGNKHAEQINEKFLKRIEAFQIEGYNGDLVWTSPVLYSMKEDFEAIAERDTGKAPFFNCTEGGAQINGFEQIPFLTFIKQYTSNNKKEIMSHKKKEQANFDVITLLKSEMHQYNQIIELCEKALKVLYSNKSTTQFSPEVLKKLDKYDKKFRKLVNGLPVESITVPVSMNVLRNYLPKVNETSEEAYNRVSKQNEELYAQLKDAIIFALDIVKQELENLEKEG